MNVTPLPSVPRDPAVLDRVEELDRNCNIGKYRHFNAASRAKNLSDCLGLPVVAINIILGSVFFIALSQELPAIAKWSGGFLALTAALIGGIATFFNFGKQFEGHRGIANKYVALAVKCETAIARYRDGLIDLGELDAFLQEFQERYTEISEEAKAFSTSKSDFKVALESETTRISTIRKRRNASFQETPPK
ncbi:MAG: SLATT domain-containing protein [Proteobacteria bacterium]|nr:SLATT domain-containing protein [Pseudomonadota bacterium]